MTRQMKIFRQGDVLLKEVTTIPKDAQISHTDIVAEGEKTGHNHRLDGSFQLFQLSKNNESVMYLEIEQETKLVHQEHNRVMIPKGLYVVVHERQYNPFADIKLRETRVID